MLRQLESAAEYVGSVVKGQRQLLHDAGERMMNETQNQLGGPYL